jgi:uncharacterized protein
MNDIELKMEPHGKGAFVIEDGSDRVAEMAFGITGSNMTVFHTQVADKLKGQGVAPKLVVAMVDYARKNNLKVIPLCPYVHAQFKRRPEEYSDVWNQNWHG